jgi:hypothetical protein
MWIDNIEAKLHPCEPDAEQLENTGHTRKEANENCRFGCA